MELHALDGQLGVAHPHDHVPYTGDLDTCINIRSTFVRDGTAYLQAGCGVVADSDAQDETRESEAKAGSVMDAIRLACEQADWA